MNRNVLKIIAVISMLIDHIGYFLLENNLICRAIGRIAMPIFAFFIAEGMKHTRNRKRYVLTLLLFAIISQIPHILVTKGYMLNILFTFLIAISIILIIENFKVPVLPVILSVVICFITYFLGILSLVDYGVFGVLLVLVFYFCKNNTIKYLLGSLVIILLSVNSLLIYGYNLFSVILLLALISILLLYFYNGEKGKLNLKWFFYIFYPTHLFVIYLIQLIL